MALAKGSKKREAPAQMVASPPSKKRKEKPSTATTSQKNAREKHKASASSGLKASAPKAAAPQPRASRKVPVTSAQLVGENSGSDSDLDIGEDAEILSDGVEGDEGDFEGVEEEEAEFEDGQPENDRKPSVGDGPQKEKNSAYFFPS